MRGRTLRAEECQGKNSKERRRDHFCLHMMGNSLMKHTKATPSCFAESTSDFRKELQITSEAAPSCTSSEDAILPSFNDWLGQNVWLTSPVNKKCVLSCRQLLQISGIIWDPSRK